MKVQNILYPILIMIYAVFTVQGYAQRSSLMLVSGTVVDANEVPLEGVTIEILESSTLQTATNREGEFTLEADLTDIIVLNKPGYNTLRVVASSITNSPLIMQESLIDAGDSDDVYIPFGVRKQRNLTYAVSSISGDEISQMPLSSFEQALSGLLPGVYISPISSGPGQDNATILLRGRSSYNDNQTPLILVDGVERNISDLDAREVESVSVLKDAASAAWYGTRGANGVILVTTKQGSEGRTRVTFDVFGGVQMPQYYTDPLDSYTYASLYNEALTNDGLSARYSTQALNSYQDVSDPHVYPDNNFVDRFLNSTAPVQHYNTTVSGGTSNTKYFTSLSYYNQGGLFAESSTSDYDANASYKRFNFRSNLDVNVTPALDVKLNIAGRQEDRISPGESTEGISNFLNSIFLTPPNAYAVRNEDGTFGGSSLFQNNPLAMLQHDGYSSEVNRMLMASAQVRYKLDTITEGLSLSGMYAYDVSGVYTRGRSQDYEVYELNPETGDYSRYGNRTELSFIDASFSSPYRNTEYWLGFDYDRNFGVHGLNASIRYNNASTLNPIFSSFDYNRTSLSSRISYNYARRYLIDLVLTYADAQRFSPNQRTGLFPAVSAGWVVTDEGFIRDNNFVNYLKIHASYGITGSDQLYGARLYSWKPLYATGFFGYNFGSGFSNTGSGVGEASLANEDLTFEKSNKFNVGFDVKLLNQSLTLVADYFIDKRTDIISPVYLPGSIGQSMVPSNYGEAQSQGIETALDYYLQVDRFTMNFFGNVTYATSNLEEFREVPGTLEHQKEAGYPLGNFGLMYNAVGFFETQDEIDNAPQQQLSGMVRPGDLRYEDINGDGVIDENDRIMTDHTPIPGAYYAFGTTMKFAGFDLTALFTGVYSRSVDIREAVYAGSANTGYINEFSVDRWTPETASEALWPRLGISDRGNNTASSTFWIRSGDFLQLKNIELGYSLPSRIVNQLNIGSCRFYVSGYNLVTFSSLNDLNINPLMVNAGRSGNYPYLATFTGGVNIEF